MSTITDKQRTLLSKYLTEDRIEKLDKMKFKVTSEFIGMVLHFRWYHPVVGERHSVPYLKRYPTKEEKEIVEKLVNKNKSRFRLLTDEYATLHEVNYLPSGIKWYIIRQTWFKGMSNSPSHCYTSISESCEEEFEGIYIYNMLFDSEVYSISNLVHMYADALQELSLKEGL